MIKNVFYSFGINFINLLFPLLLIPFYIKIFGINHYGIIAIVNAILSYVAIITDYSWAVYGPIEIGKSNYDRKWISKYISKVINTKFLLSLLSIVLLLVAISFYGGISKNFPSLFALLLMLFSRSQNVHWIFIGINKISVYFYMYAFCKTASILVIFLTLKPSNSYIDVFFILASFDTLLFVLGYIYLYYCNDFRYITTSFGELIIEIKLGYKMFMTNLSICSLSNSSTMIIGFFLGQQAAGIFNVAERIIMLCKNSVGVLFLGIFPKICSIGIGNTAEFKKTLRFMLKTYILIFSVGTVLLICFLHPIILFFTKHSVSLIKHYVICLSLLPLIAAVGQPAYITLLLHDKKNIYFSAYFFGLVLNLIISFIMCFYFSVAGILFTLIVTEIFISTYMNYFVYKEDKMNYLKSQSNH